MSTILIFIGTFIMLAGSVIVMLGLVLLRAPQETLGRMYLSITSVGAAEDHTSGIIRHLADIRGNDEEKRRKSLKLVGIGIVGGLIGAVIFPL